MSVAYAPIEIPFVPPPPTGEALEALARDMLRRQIGLRVAVRSPTWRELLFGQGRIELKIPRCPDEVLARIDEAPPVVQPEDPVAKLAAKMLADLRDARPRGTTPRSVSPRAPRPPARDAMAAWLRRVFLVAAGPEAARLLVSAGYLTASDVDTLQAAYPDGLDTERRDAVEATGALTAAAARHGSEPDLRPWLNDQLLTLLDEHRPADFFNAIYDGEGKDGGDESPGPTASAPPSNVVDQTRPGPEGP